MMAFVCSMSCLLVAIPFAWALGKWRHRALVAEHDLAELRTELRHQSHVQDARRRLIGELVDARARRN